MMDGGMHKYTTSILRNGRSGTNAKVVQGQSHMGGAGTFGRSGLLTRVVGRT